MPTTNPTKQRKPLNGYHRRAQRSRTHPVVSTRTVLPPVEEFADASADLRAKLTDWHTLAEQARTHSRAARLAEDAATIADREHTAAVRAALTAGKDVAKVRASNAENLRQEAEAHREHHRAATAARERLGYDLAPLLEAEAVALTPAVDARLADAAARITALLDSLEAEFTTWGAAFNLRVWLSRTELNGGAVTNFDGASRLPNEVAAALTTLTVHLTEPERLRSDEDEVRTFREATQ